MIVPGGSPKSVSGGFVSETELYVTWEKIPVSLQNGIIRSYKIAIRMKDSSEEWNVTSVNSQTFRKDIGGLRYYTLYDVKVAGETSRGLGPYSFPIYIRTDAYGNKTRFHCIFYFISPILYDTKKTLNQTCTIYVE